MRTHTMNRKRMILLGLLCLSVACETSTEPRRVLLPGIIEGWGGIPVVDVTSEGGAVTIRAVTYGMDGCWWKGTIQFTTDAESHVLTAEAWDWTQDPLGVCFDSVVTFHHELTVELAEGGTWTIVVKGDKWLGADGRTATSVSRTIDVSL